MVVALWLPLPAGEVRRLAESVHALLQGRHPVVCDVRGPLDLDVLDLLARLRLAAARQHTDLSVRPWGDWAGLLELAGLGGLLAPVGQAEAGEQRGVEEVVDVRDLPG